MHKILLVLWGDFVEKTNGGYRNILFITRPDDLRSLAPLVEATKEAIREMGGSPDINIACQPFHALLIMEAEKRIGRTIGLAIISAPQIEVKPELDFIRDMRKINENTCIVVVGWSNDEYKFASHADRFIRKEDSVFKLGGMDLREFKEAVKEVLGALKVKETPLQIKKEMTRPGPSGGGMKAKL